MKSSITGSNGTNCQNLPIGDLFGLFGEAVVLLVFTLLSILGNCLLQVITLMHEGLKSLKAIFIVNLAVSHYMFTIGLFWFACNFIIEIRSEHLNTASTISLHVGFYSSTFFLMTMSLHRYLLVVHPLTDHTSRVGRHGIAISAIVWTVSLSAALPGKTDCYVGVRMNVIFFFFLCVVIFCFVRIFQTEAKTTGERRDSRVTFIIVVVYVLLWSPVSISLILIHFFSIFYVFELCRLISCAHCFLVPIFYILLEDKFKSFILGICRKRRGLPTSIDVEMSSIL